MRNHDNAQTRKIKINQRQAIHKYKLKPKMNSFLSKTCKEVRYQVLKEKLPADIKDDFSKCISDQQEKGCRFSGS